MKTIYDFSAEEVLSNLMNREDVKNHMRKGNFTIFTFNDYISMLADNGFLEEDLNGRTVEEFKKDMYFHYIWCKKCKKLKNPSIERIDVDGNYCKENCTFIERNEQMKNTRNVIFFKAISPEGVEFREKNASVFSKKHNINLSCIYKCLKGQAKQHKGWQFTKLEV